MICIRITGVLSHKLRNSNRYRESHRLLRTRLPLHTGLSSDTIVSSLAAGRPIYCDRTYFYRLRDQVFWVGRWHCTTSIRRIIYVVYCLPWSFILCVALRRCNQSELQRSLGDAAFRHSALNLQFDLSKSVCDRTFRYIIA